MEQRNHRDWYYAPRFVGANTNSPLCIMQDSIQTAPDGQREQTHILSFITAQVVGPRESHLCPQSHTLWCHFLCQFGGVELRSYLLRTGN